MTASLELQQANLGSERMNLTDVVLLPQDIEQISECSLLFLREYIRSIRSSLMALQFSTNSEHYLREKEYLVVAFREWRRLGRKIEKLIADFEASYTQLSQEEVTARANDMNSTQEKRDYYTGILKTRRLLAAVQVQPTIRVEIEVYEYEYLKYLLSAEMELRKFIQESRQSRQFSAKLP